MKKLVPAQYRKAAVAGIVGAFAVGGLLYVVRMLPSNQVTSPVKKVADATIGNR